MEQQLIKSIVDYDDFTHSYELEGKYLLGVTSLMKKHGLSANYEGISNEVLEAAAERGTRVHKMLEDYDNGVMVEDNPLLSSYRRLRLKVLSSEYLVSDNKIVASSIDKVLDDYSIADVKTTSEVHTEALRWQLSIYKYLFELQNPQLKVNKLYCIHIPLKKAIDGTYAHKFCKKIEIEPLPAEKVIKLLECEQRGEIYHDEQVEAVPDLSVLFNPTDLASLQSIENRIIEFEENAKMLKEKVSEYRSTIQDYMSAHNIKTIGTERLKYTLVAPYTKQMLDCKLLTAEMPEIAQKYTKTSEVKGSLKFTFKNN
jgi:hypothetical protein